MPVIHLTCPSLPHDFLLQNGSVYDLVYHFCNCVFKVRVVYLKMEVVSTLKDDFREYPCGWTRLTDSRDVVTMQPPWAEGNLFLLLKKRRNYRK